MGAVCRDRPGSKVCLERLTMSASRHSSLARRRHPQRWLEKVFAAIALLNLVLVLFDLSYIPMRDIYLQHAPAVTEWYGAQFKGIQPERFTQSYLAAVDEFENQVQLQGLGSPEISPHLSTLRRLSADMVDENPFASANKSGTLERIKQRVKTRLTETTGQRYDSSKQAFEVFWSRAYLEREGLRQELMFFDDNLRPLLETNYFRGIGFDGQPTNEFLKIDIWFIGLFAVEILTRLILISRRRRISLLDAGLMRWYDLLLLIPFSVLVPALGLLRVVPVTIRLHRARLINLHAVRDRLIRFLLAGVAVEMTEIVIVQVIDQLQLSLRRGEISQRLLTAAPRYINLNNVDELSEISQRLSLTLINHVLPSTRTDAEALLKHTVDRALLYAPGYQGVKRLPGVSAISDQITQRVIKELYEAFYLGLTEALKDDPEGARLARTLWQNLGTSFRTGLQKDNSISEIESLLAIWLEELKISYVKQIASEDIETLREQNQKIYEITQGIVRSPSPRLDKIP
jgi:hypothetical protein